PPPPPPPPPPSDGIAQARAAADGATTLAISGVTVTYLKPAIGSDPAGFTIQHDETGPALFVAVDPATLSPAATVGDIVNFTITQMGTAASQRRAQAVASYARQSTGASIAALTQNVSAATDLVSAVDNYDSEIITAVGTVGTFAASGTAFQSAMLSTAGISGNASLQIRLPSTVIDSVDVVNSCQITATQVPLGRFNATVQVGVYRAGDIALSACPAPTVASAAALSATSVQVSFTRHLTPASVSANGSQFTFDNGLTASAATLSGRTVTVTTSVQSTSTSYGVTVAHSITDLQGTALATPDVASFSGFVTPAVLRINEFSANITGGCDLIELRVITGGSIGGFHIQERTGSVASNELSFSFPTMTVATNDMIVVHVNAASATCNPGGATQETLAKNQQPAASFGGNYDNAFDFWATDNGLTSTDNVLTILNGIGAIVDAVFASDDPAGLTTTTATKQAAGAVGTANQWSPAMASYNDTTFRQNAVDDLNATGATATGNSIQRVDNTDDNNRADWTTGAGVTSTFGSLNAGQTAFPSRRRAL
ncbi:MAG: Ig-like domain-containing protein, partial [Gemmatimonadales bacterium]